MGGSENFKYLWLDIDVGDLAALNSHLDAFLHHATERQPSVRPPSLEGEKVELSEISHALKDPQTVFAWRGVVFPFRAKSEPKA